MKYTLFLLLIAVLWAIKVYAGYYILTWLKDRLLPMWYRWRGINPKSMEQTDLAPVLKAVRFASHSRHLSASSCLERVEKLYAEGNHNTQDLCAAALEDSSLALEDIETEFGKDIANIVRENRLKKPLNGASREDQDLPSGEK